MGHSLRRQRTLEGKGNTDKTTLKCDKEFDGKGVGAQREKEKRGGEDG